MSHDETNQHEDHEEGPDDITVRVQALERLLTAQGLVDPAAIDALIDTFENRLGPHIGARIAARAWSDPTFKQRLLNDANSVLAEEGISHPESEGMMVLENSDRVHNVIVCTLCSCYPWTVLGLPPNWYKSPAYRSRIVREPRTVLREFGLDIPAATEVRVWDSTAELRYMVLPMRPAGTDGMSESKLAALVTRDSMLGVGMALVPADQQIAES